MYFFFGISGDPPRRIFNQTRASSKSIHQLHGGELLGYACVCGGETSPRIRRDRAKIVFSGTVIEVNDKAVKLEVGKAYKGNVEKEVILAESYPATTCNIPFRKGEKYLVYRSEEHTSELQSLRQLV